jgi:hypothetical protein
MWDLVSKTGFRALAQLLSVIKWRVARCVRRVNEIQI